MSVRTILRSEFDRWQPLHPALENLMGEQVEWFSNRSGSMLGTVAKGEGVAGWNYAILKRDKQGDFHLRKVMGNLFCLEDARVDLLLSMAGIEKIDGANRDTENSWLPSIPAELFTLNPER